MQKWEYLRLDVFFEESEAIKRVRALMVNYVQTSTNIPFSDLHNYINKLGSEGWELVSERAASGQQHNSYYFKRPKE